MSDIVDGASNTIMCVEAGPDKVVPWTKPEDLPFDPQKPLEAMGKLGPNWLFAVAYFDGSVENLSVDNPSLKCDHSQRQRAARVASQGRWRRQPPTSPGMLKPR